MLKHMYYRLESADGKGAATYSAYEMGKHKLIAPELDFSQKYEFWFTQQGVKEVGIHCFRAMKRCLNKNNISVRKADAFPNSLIAYEDQHQIAICLGGY